MTFARFERDRSRDRIGESHIRIARARNGPGKRLGAGARICQLRRQRAGFIWANRITWLNISNIAADLASIAIDVPRRPIRSITGTVAQH